MAETLSTLSIIAFIIAGVCLALAIIFWIVFRIPAVIGDLSGKTAKKSIAKMRAANEKTGAKPYRESKANAARVKVTDSMPDSARLKKKKQQAEGAMPETGVLAENRADATPSEETGLLESEGTELLDSEETGLLDDSKATEPLTPQPPVEGVRAGGKKLKILEEIMMVHTDEVIS